MQEAHVAAAGADVGGAVFGAFLILGVLAGIVALTVFALLKLKRARIDDVARVIWAIFVVTVPVLGPVTLYIVGLGEDAREAGKSGDGDGTS